MASNLKSMLSVATRSTGFNANAWTAKPLVRPAVAEPREMVAAQTGFMTSARTPALYAPMFSLGPCPPGFHKINVGTRSEACAPDVAAPIAINTPLRLGTAWLPNVTPRLQTTILGPGVTVQPVMPAAQPVAQPVATPASYPQASSPPGVVTQPIAPVMAPEVPAGVAPAKSGTGTLLAAAGVGFLVGGPIGAVIGAGAGYFLSKR